MKLLTNKELERKLWRSACQHDGIPEDSMFVVFSEDNPFVEEHSEIMGKILKGEGGLYAEI